jgi:hypothetical protein
MPLAVWTQPSGYSLGTFPELETFKTGQDNGLLLPVSTTAGLTFSLISGSLPPGIGLTNASLTGTPYNIIRTTTFTFCIRASNGIQISDRTFNITIEGGNPPEFITPAGPLSITTTKYFVLDKSFVNFQVKAFDSNPDVKLSYFISSTGGELPPGLSLSTSGKITGVVDPVTSVKPQDGNGSYDTGTYDGIAYDFGTVKELNRTYSFTITVSDGDNYAERTFEIFVVGGNFFTADNTALTDDNILFTADNTNIRNPVWITDSDLGNYRSNNYMTIPLSTYDKTNIIYSIDPINAEIAASTYKILQSDNKVGSYNLTVQYVQTAPTIGKYLTFLNSVSANQWYKNKSYTYGDIVRVDNAVYECITSHKSYNDFNGFVIDFANGYWKIFPAEVEYQISHVASLGSSQYRLTLSTPLQLNVPNGWVFYIGDLTVLPPGLTYDTEGSVLYGVVPFQPLITKTYKFTMTASRAGNDGEVLWSSKMFTLNIIGEGDSVISWITPPNLGEIDAGFISVLNVQATSSLPNATVVYSLVSGNLPPGLSLNLDGEIIGITNQYPIVTGPTGIVLLNDGGLSTSLTSNIDDGGVANENNILSIDGGNSYSVDNIINVVPGLTTFDFSTGQTLFDGGSTTIDRVFTFTVEARDLINYTAQTRTFTVKVNTVNEKLFSNITVKPFLKLDQRDTWQTFINDASVFTPSSIYRPNDPNFGLQHNLKMVVYAGIETSDAAKYVSAIGLNHKRKRFQWSDIKKAVAISKTSGSEVYEIVYVNMVDPLELNGKHLPSKIHSDPKSGKVTIDKNNAFWQSGFVLPNATLTAQMGADGLNTGRPDPLISIDSQEYQISDSSPSEYYPSSISIWRNRIENWSAQVPDPNNPGSNITLTLAHERNYLPLWMRTIQPGTYEEIGFQLAVPLCYCKVGTADNIILNIKHDGFDFKQIDYTIDRYIIDSVANEIGDKYLVFKNDRITV